MTFFLKKLCLLFCPSYKGVGQKHSLNLCVTFSKMARRGCRLQSRKQSLGLVRPCPQPSFELQVWAEGEERKIKDQRSPTMDPLMLLYVGFWRLGVTDSPRNEKWSPPSFCGSPNIYLLKTYCVFQHHAKPPPAALLSMLLSQDALHGMTFAICPVVYPLLHPIPLTKCFQPGMLLSPAPKPSPLIGLVTPYSPGSRVKSFMKPSSSFPLAGYFVLQYDLVDVNKNVYFILCSNYLLTLVSLQIISPLRAE